MWQKLIKYLFCKFSHLKIFRKQWNVNHIYSNKNSEMTSGFRKWKNRFKREKIVILAKYLWEETDYRRYKRKIRKSGGGPSWRRNQPYLFTFPYRTNGNHATELSIVGYVISERHWKSTFDFTETVNNYELKRRTLCQIIKFKSHSSLKLYIQYWNFFVAWS